MIFSKLIRQTENNSACLYLNCFYYDLNFTLHYYLLLRDVEPSSLSEVVGGVAVVGRLLEGRGPKLPELVGGVAVVGRLLEGRGPKLPELDVVVLGRLVEGRLTVVLPEGLLTVVELPLDWLADVEYTADGFG